MIVTTVTSSPGINTNTIVESTTDSGVEIRRIETQWATVVTPGAVLNPATFQITSRVTTESHWAPFSYVDGSSGATVTIPSTKLNSRKTTTELLGGQAVAVGYTGGNYVWVQGGRFQQAIALLQTAEVL
jgi:hypothetical protein